MQKADTYYIFRELYCRYVCKLHSISSNSESALGLITLFEELLQVYDPELCMYLSAKSFNYLQIAFKWIFYGFIGFLEVDQLYHLWDRVIGYDSLELLPIMAVAIFIFRANLILNCNTNDEFEENFYDLSQIKTVPLLQHLLFANDIN
jgi:hypothetical protein